MDDEYITQSAAARLLGIKPATVQDKRKRGTLPQPIPCQCGHGLLYRRSDILRYKEERDQRDRAS